MGDENQMDQGPVVPPQAKEKAEHGVTHARKAAEDLGSAAGAMADEYRARGRGMGRCAPSCPQFSGRQQAIRPRKPDQGGLYRARSRSRARFDFPSLEGRRCAAAAPDVPLRSALRV